MYGASTNYPAPWQSTLPWSPYGRQGYDTFPTSVIVIRSRPDYTYGNEPLAEVLRWQNDQAAETKLEKKRRISREQRQIAAARLLRFGLPPLVEAMFHKPTFVKRACGGR